MVTTEKSTHEINNMITEEDEIEYREELLIASFKEISIYQDSATNNNWVSFSINCFFTRWMHSTEMLMEASKTPVTELYVFGHH